MKICKFWFVLLVWRARKSESILRSCSCWFLGRISCGQCWCFRCCSGACLAFFATSSIINGRIPVWFGRGGDCFRSGHHCSGRMFRDPLCRKGNADVQSCVRELASGTRMCDGENWRGTVAVMGHHCCGGWSIGTACGHRRNTHSDLVRAE